MTAIKNLLNNVTTGHDIREKLSELELERDLLRSDFNESLFMFEGDKKKSPQDIYAEYAKTEECIALVQTTQSKYNHYVKIEDGHELTYAIKYLGALTRMEGMWRSITHHSGYYQNQRDKDTEYAESTLTDSEKRKYIKEAARKVARMRRQIAQANATKVSVEKLS